MNSKHRDARMESTGGTSASSLAQELWNTDSALLRHPEWVADIAVSPFVTPSESIFVTGFWRSGTTWLQQSLSRIYGAKSVFEPLRPRLRMYRSQFPESDSDYIHQHMPFVQSGQLQRTKIGRIIHLAIKGALPGLGVRYARPGGNRKNRLGRVLERVQTALKVRVIVKSVRCHFLIPEISRLFDPVMVHIRRDPRSIIASMLREGWTDSWAGTLSLKDQLIRPDDGRREYLEPWHDDLRKIDDQGLVAEWAAYWSIVEQFVEEIPGNDRRVVLEYESLVRGGANYLSERLGALIQHDVDPNHLQENSATTSSERRSASEEERIRGWSQTLSREEHDRIERVVSHFGMEKHLNA